MEKYRKFADEKTGKHPFLPIRGSQPPLQTFIAFILMPMRLTALAFVLICSIISSLIFRNSQMPLARMVEQLIAKMFLMALNVRVTIQNPEELNKLSSTPSIILSNRSSFIDSMILRSV
jgi:hypothetical protein